MEAKNQQWRHQINPPPGNALTTASTQVAISNRQAVSLPLWGLPNEGFADLGGSGTPQHPALLMQLEFAVEARA